MNVLASVYDRTGLAEFLNEIRDHMGEIFATEGTHAYLEKSGIRCRKLGDITGFNDMFGGRVKSLHPAVYAGILNPSDFPDDLMKKSGFVNFDMVISNLYPFREAATSSDLNRIVENIDVGGVSLTRAAAKNFQRVSILTDPADYGKIAEEINKHGIVSPETRKYLAVKAFSVTAEYDSLIYGTLSKVLNVDLENFLSVTYRTGKKLRYGENPDQAGYVFPDGSGSGIPGSFQLSGKEMSYNNVMDASAAMDTAYEYEMPACVIVKHNVPCGTGCSEALPEAFEKAWNSDRESAYGGVVCFNRTLDGKTAEKISDLFLEVVCAPDFSTDAFSMLRKKKNLRLLKVRYSSDSKLRLRSVTGGILAQTPLSSEFGTMKCVTDASASDEQIKDLIFAWKTAAHCKSNAIVLARDLATVGIGSGQTSRIESLRIASRRAGERSRGSVLASDGFFPFADNVDLAHEIGVTAIIQPGGSIRDADSIEAANRYGISMYFTGKRTFLH